MAKKYSRKLNFNASAKLEEKVKVAEPLYWLIVVMLITLSIVLVAITVPRPFGFVTAGEEKTYVQNLNIELNETTVYEWTLSVAEEQAQLTALAVSGSVIGNGNARIWLIGDEGNRLLIFDSDESEPLTGMAAITGFSATDVPAEEQQPAETPTEEVPSEEQQQEEQPIETPVEEGNASEEVNATEELPLEENLTQPEEIAIEENITEIANETLPEENVTEENITEQPPAEEIPQVQELVFKNECADTCYLPAGFDKTSYTLFIEIEQGATLKLDSIAYTLFVPQVETLANVINIINVTITNETVFFATTIEDASNNTVPAVIEFADSKTEDIKAIGKSEKGDREVSAEDLVQEEQVTGEATVAEEGNVSEEITLPAEENLTPPEEIAQESEEPSAEGQPLTGLSIFTGAATAEQLQQTKIANDVIEEAAGEPGIEIPKGKYKIKVTLQNHPIKDIEFADIDVDQNIADFIKIDDTPEFGAFIEVYAIDPTAFNFTTATVTGIAVGDALYKCKDWDFTNQTCFGSWTKLMDLTPGQEYSFTLTPEDPGFGQTITQTCAAEDSAAKGSFGSACTGTYPGNCNSTADLLTCEDTFTEQHSMTSTGYAGVKITTFNSSVADCTSITSVFVCFDWWTVNAAGPADCDISVDNQNGTNFTAVNTTCPPQGASTGLKCQNVTSVKNWTCGNFFGNTTGNRSMIKSETVRSSGAAAKTVYWDALYFNITNYTAVVNDTTAPVVTIIAPSPVNNSYINSTSAIINASVTDTQSNISVCTLEFDSINETMTRVGSGTSVTCNSTKTSLSQGLHNFTVYANDTFNNTGQNGTWFFTVDTVYPTIQFVTPTETSGSILSRSNIQVNVTATDTNLNNITIRLYNSTSLVNSTTTSTSPNFINFTNLANGVYYFNATAIDKAGNSNSTETRNVTIDTQGPTITFVTPTPANNTIQSSTSTTINVTATNGVAVDTCTLEFNGSNSTMTKVGSGANVTCNYTKTGLSDGNHTYKVYANDTAGNMNVSEIRTLRVDTIKPQVQFVAPTTASGNYSQNFIVANVTATDANLATITVYLYNSTGLRQSNSSGTSPLFVNFTSLSDGTYYLNATANDTAGNINQTETRTIVLDTTAPSIAIVSPQNTTYNNRTILVNISTSGATNIWYNWNGTNVTYTVPVYVTFAEGSNTLYVYANDSAGNLNSTSVTFTTDTIAPTISIISPTNTTYNNRTILVNISTSGAANVWYNWNGTNTTYTSPVYVTFAEGSNTLYAYANDSVGNLNSTSVSFTTDTIKPAIQFVAPTETSGTTITNRSNILVNATATDVNLANITIRLYNSTSLINNVTTTTSPNFANFTSLPNGLYYFNATAFDSVGNFNNTETRNVTINVTVDTSPPVITYLAPANNSLDPNGQVIFNVSETDNVGLKNITLYINGILNQTQNISGTSNSTIFNVSLANGNYNWSVRIYDNASASNYIDSDLRYLTVDTTAVPVYTNFTGNTTNWPSVPDLTNVCDGTAIVDIPPTGMIRWFNCVNASHQNFDINVNLSNNFVDITFGLNPTFNSSAQITIRNLTWEATPDILMNGEICDYVNVCQNITYNNATGILTFDVAHFTNFTTVGNSQLAIWDQNDTGMPGGNLPACASSQIKFFANYSKTSNNNPITGATCIINFTDSSGNTMTYNATSLFYEYNRTFSTIGNKPYNVTCSKSGSQTITLSDSVDVSDCSAPTTALVSPANNTLTANTSLNFTCNATDDVQLSNITFYWNYTGTFQANGTTAVSGTANQTTFQRASLSDNVILWNCNACDTSNLCSFAPANWTVTIDATKPTIQFVSPTETSGTYLNRNNILANVTASDTNLANITIYLYNTTSQVNSTTTLTSPNFANFTSLANGLYYFNATAFDSAGNSNSTETRNVTIDTIKPAIQFVAPTPANGSTVNETQTINVTATDTNFANVTIFIDTSPVLTCTSSPCAYTWDTTTYLNGLHTFNATAYDLASNSNSTETRTVNVSNAGVNVVFIAPTPANGTVQSSTTATINVSVMSSSAIDTCTLEFDGSNETMTKVGAGTNVTCNKIKTGLSETTHTYKVYANDTLGSVGDSETRVLIIDLTKPQVQFVSPTETSGSVINRNNILTNVTASDTNLANITTRLFNSSGQINSSTSSTSPLFTNFTGLNNGLYYFNATAFDKANNQNSTETRNVTIDTIAPSISIISPTNTTYNNRTQLVNISTSGATNVWYNWNGTNTTYTVPVYVTFNEGSNTLYAYANDTAGNLNSTSVSFTADTTAPNITNVTTNPVLPIYNNGTSQNITTNFTSSEYPINITFYLYYSNGSVANTQGPYTINNASQLPVNYTIPANLADGNYTLNMTAKDNVGNTATVFVGTFIVDKTKPSIQFVSPTPANNANVTGIKPINVTATDTNLASIEIFFDGGSVKTCTSPPSPCSYNFDTTILVEGSSHNFVATAKDSANNTNSTEIRYYTVDNTAPSIDFITPPTPVNDSTVNVSTVTIATNVNDTSGIDKCVLNFDGTNVSTIADTAGTCNFTRSSLANGLHNFTVYVNDTTDPTNSTETRFFTVNATIPPPSAAEGGRPVEFAYPTPPVSEPIPEAILEGPYYIGDFALASSYDWNGGVNEMWVFTYQNINHTARIIRIVGGFVDLQVDSKTTHLRLYARKSKDVDITEDNIADIRFTLNNIVQDRANLNIRLIPAKLKFDLQNFLVILLAIYLIWLFSKRRRREKIKPPLLKFRWPQE